MKRFLPLLVFIFLGLLGAPKVFAAQEFSTTYNVIVTVDPAGVSHVSQGITITNLQGGTFAKEYSVTISSTNLENVSATSSIALLKATTKVENGKTTVTIPFPNKVIGQGKVLPFTLSYDVPNYVTQTNSIRTLMIPKIAISDDVTDYTLDVTVPKSFGDPSILSPKPTSTTNQYASQTWHFDKATAANQSIYAIFGAAQYYAFSFSQTLSNPNLVTVNKDVVILPQTPYQTVLIDGISPKPANIHADADGNWIATFAVPRGKQQTVLVSGRVKISPTITRNITIDKNTASLDKQPQLYWETDDQRITSIVDQLIKPLAEADQTAVETKAQQIYQYVVSTLTPEKTTSQTNQNRLGAAAVSTQPSQAGAYEFADLYVALARASGIPARELFGILVNQSQPNDSSLSYITHVWPEYYSPQKGWIAVDPLLASVTQTDYFQNWDVRHIALTIWASDSENPYPDYVGDNLQDMAKQFHLATTQPFTVPIPELNITVRLVTGAVSGIPERAEVVVTNNGKTATDQTNLSVSSSDFQILGQTSFAVPALPPQASISIPFTLRSKSFFSFSESTVQININGKTYAIPVSVKPFGGHEGWVVALALLIGASIGGGVLWWHHRSLRLAASRQTDQSSHTKSPKKSKQL